MLVDVGDVNAGREANTDVVVVVAVAVQCALETNNEKNKSDAKTRPAQILCAFVCMFGFRGMAGAARQILVRTFGWVCLPLAFLLRFAVCVRSTVS